MSSVIFISIIVFFIFLIGISVFISVKTFSSTFSDRDGDIIFDSPVQGGNPGFTQGLVTNGVVPGDQLQKNQGATTYSFWLYVHDLATDPGSQKILFERSDNATSFIDIRAAIEADQNTLEITCSTKHGDIAEQESFHVQDLPIQSWCFLTITKTPRSVDVYLNGRLVRTNIFKGVAVAPGGSYPIRFFQGGALTGFLSRFKVIYRKMSLTEIEASARAGPMNTIDYNIKFRSPIVIQNNIVKNSTPY